MSYIKKVGKRYRIVVGKGYKVKGSYKSWKSANRERRTLGF